MAENKWDIWDYAKQSLNWDLSRRGDDPLVVDVPEEQPAPPPETREPDTFDEIPIRDYLEESETESLSMPEQPESVDDQGVEVAALPATEYPPKDVPEQEEIFSPEPTELPIEQPPLSDEFEEIWSVNPPAPPDEGDGEPWMPVESTEAESEFDETPLRDFLEEREDDLLIPELPSESEEEELLFAGLPATEYPPELAPEQEEIFLPEQEMEPEWVVADFPDASDEPPLESITETLPVPSGTPPVSWDDAFPPIPSLEESLMELEQQSSWEATEPSFDPEEPPQILDPRTRSAIEFETFLLNLRSP